MIDVLSTRDKIFLNLTLNIKIIESEGQIFGAIVAGVMFCLTPLEECDKVTNINKIKNRYFIFNHLVVVVPENIWISTIVHKKNCRECGLAGVVIYVQVHKETGKGEGIC